MMNQLAERGFDDIRIMWRIVVRSVVDIGILRDRRSELHSQGLGKSINVSQLSRVGADRCEANPNIFDADVLQRSNRAYSSLEAARHATHAIVRFRVTVQ